MCITGLSVGLNINQKTQYSNFITGYREGASDLLRQLASGAPNRELRLNFLAALQKSAQKELKTAELLRERKSQ